jgi:hypothetical protein
MNSSEFSSYGFYDSTAFSLPLYVTPTVESPCTGEAFDVILADGFKVSTGNPNGIQWVGKRIRIADNATVRFDRNVLISGCEVRAGTLSKIIVEGASTLTANNNSTFDGCTNMWIGIQVSANAAVQLSGSNFLHAMRALDFLKDHNQVASSITNCNFLANHIGIQVGTINQGGQGGVQFFLSNFTGNNFTGGDVLPPLVLQKSYAGIIFSKCPIGIVPPNNNFIGMKAGIISQSSFVLIWKCSFSDMVVSRGWGGFGISSTSSSLTVSECTFKNDEKRGIWSSLAKGLYVGDSVFDGEWEYGIFSEANSIPGNIWMLRNKFFLKQSNDISAIYHERSPSSSTVGSTNRIVDNSVFAFTSPTRLKNISFVDINCLNGGKDEFQIRENDIATALAISPMHGLFVRGNSSRLSIAKNDLSFSGFPRPLGIIANLGIAVVNVNGLSNRIDSNTVTSQLYKIPVNNNEEASSFIKCGVHIALSPNLQICANSTNNTFRGFHFEGNIDYCDFSINNVGNHWHGVHCNTGTVPNQLGEQNWHQNKWNGAYVGFGANYLGGMPPYKFRVDPAKPFNKPPSVNINDWFIDLTTNNDNSNCIDGSEPQGPRLSDSDNNIISGTYPIYNTVSTWDLERELLLKLERFPALMPPGSAARTFYDSKSSSSSLQFAKAQKLYDNTFEFPEILQSSINSLYSAQKGLFDAVLLLQNDSTATATDKQNLANQINLIGDSIDLRLAQISAFKSTALLLAETWNLGLSDATPFEYNLKNVLALYIKTAKGDSLTEADYNILRNIANQCPSTGGRAVYSAPYLLPHAESIGYLDEDYTKNACNNLRPTTTETRSEIFLKEFMVSPNPAIDLLTVFISEGFSGKWQVIDLYGKVILNGVVPVGATNFDISLNGLEGGLYFLQLKEKNALVASRKFVVLH